MFEERIRRMDLRLTKYVNITKKIRLQANLDVYNAFNNNAVQAVNTTYGTNWLQPVFILDPRLLQAFLRCADKFREIFEANPSL